MQVLDHVLAQLELHEAERSQLKAVRGFSDDTITRGRFVSAGPHIKKIVEAAAERFGTDVCAEVGLMKQTAGGHLRVWHKLLDKNVIIPFFDDAGGCSLLRPHKWQPAGVELQLYLPLDQHERDQPFVLAESEFKAWASIQFGVQAGGVPGIASFSGQHFDALYTTLERAGVRDVVVLFDNENKGDPGLPEKFKAQAAKRYDTQFYSYVMARKINERNGALTATVAWIPDQYRDNKGKADIDGMLAAGVGADVYREIIESARRPDDFLASQPSEAREVLTRKVHRAFEQSQTSPLFASGNQYMWIGEEDTLPVSNFVAEYISTIITEEDVHQYELKLTNTRGQCANVIVEPEAATDWKKLRTAVMHPGLFWWSGKNPAVEALFAEVVPADQRFVRLLDNAVGWSEKVQHFFFTNCCVDSHGRVVDYDEDGNITLDGVTYKIVREGDIPDVFFERGGTNWEGPGLHDVAKKLIQNFGTESVALVLGWFCAVALKPWLFPFNHTFPIMFLFGKRGSGKTRLCKWLTRIFFNADKSSTDTLIGQNSAAFIRNRASQLPYLPFWLDEFRNTDASLRHLDVLRGIYDHSTAGISGGVIGTNRTFRLTSALIISGEDVPDDPTGALNERMVTVRIPDTIPGIHYQLLEQLQYSFDGIFVYLLRNREKLVKQIQQEYDQLLERHRQAKVSSRIAINYALLFAVCRVVLAVKLDESAIDDVFAEIRRDDVEEDPVLDLITQACSIRRTHADPGVLHKCLFVRKSNHPDQHGKTALMFNLQDVYRVVATNERRSGRQPQSLRTLKKRILDVRWILGSNHVYKSAQGGAVRVFEVVLEKAPEAILYAAFNIAEQPERVALRYAFGGDQGPLGMIAHDEVQGMFGGRSE